MPGKSSKSLKSSKSNKLSKSLRWSRSVRRRRHNDNMEMANTAPSVSLRRLVTAVISVTLELVFFWLFFLDDGRKSDNQHDGNSDETGERVLGTLRRNCNQSSLDSSLLQSSVTATEGVNNDKNVNYTISTTPAVTSDSLHVRTNSSNNAKSHRGSELIDKAIKHQPVSRTPDAGLTVNYSGSSYLQNRQQGIVSSSNKLENETTLSPAGTSIQSQVKAIHSSDKDIDGIGNYGNNASDEDDIGDLSSILLDESYLHINNVPYDGEDDLDTISEISEEGDNVFYTRDTCDIGQEASNIINNYKSSKNRTTSLQI